MSAQQRHRLFVSHTVCLLAKGVCAAKEMEKDKKVRTGQEEEKLYLKLRPSQWDLIRGKFKAYM